MKKALLIIVLIIHYSSIFCQAPHWVFATTTNCGDGFTYNRIDNISIDSQNNLYLAGFCDSCTFGNIINDPMKYSGYFIACINSIGNYVWVKMTKNLVLGSILTDSVGHIYLTGSIIDIDTAYIDTDAIYSNNGGFFLAKLDSSGNKIWINVISGDIVSYPYLAKDSFNNIYLFGEGNKLNFGNFILNDTVDGNLFIAKFDSSGNVKWAKGVGRYAYESLSLNSYSAYFYISGVVETYYSTYLIGNDTLIFKNGADFIAKYDSSGNFLWAKNFNVACENPQMSSGTDSKGNYYLTGSQYNDSLLFGNSYIDCGRYQMYLFKFDPSGKELWARTTYQCPGYPVNYNETNVQSTGLSIDKNNNVYITGNTPKTAFGIDTVTVNGPCDLFVVKYDSSGTMKWVTTAGGDSADYSYCITTDNNGNIYIGGLFVSDSVKFGNTTLYNSHIGWYRGQDVQGLNNLFFAKLSDSNSGIISIKNDEELIIYPNPTSSAFKIKLPQQAKYLKIYDPLGQLIESATLKNQSEQSFSINENGIYIVQVGTENAVIRKKVIVSK